jgi:polyhydroxyalkanoate synthesis regulator phasin
MDVNDLRKYMEATVVKLTPAKAQEMARSISEGQSKGKGQVQRIAQDLMAWSKANRERMSEMVRREVREQLRSMGVATRDDVDALKRRVRDLERASKPSGKSASKAVGSKAAAKKVATGTSEAKPSTPTPGSSSGGTTAS